MLVISIRCHALGAKKEKKQNAHNNILMYLAQIHEHKWMLVWNCGFFFLNVSFWNLNE